MRIGKIMTIAALITMTSCTTVQNITSKLEDRTVETLVHKFDVLESKIMTDDYLFETSGIERVRQASYTRDLMEYFRDDYPSTIKSYGERKDLIKRIDAVFENSQKVYDALDSKNKTEINRAKHMFNMSIQNIIHR